MELDIRNFPDAIEEDVCSDRAGIYAWGRVTYRDFTGAGHVTNVKLVCRAKGLDSGRFHTCEDGNAAD